MKKFKICILLPMAIVLIVFRVNAQTSNVEKPGVSMSSYEQSFQNSIKKDKTLKEKVKIKCTVHINKMSQMLKLDNIQKDSLMGKYTDFILHMDFARDSILNTQEREHFNNIAFANYENDASLIYTEEQKLTLKNIIEKKSNEKKFRPYIEDHADEYKPVK